MAMETDTGAGLDAGQSALRRRISQFVNDHILLVLLGPPLILIAAVFVYPVLWMFYQSLFMTVPGLDARFQPLFNYEAMFTSEWFYTYLYQTLYYSFGSLILSLTSGLVVALAINHVRKQWIRSTYSTVILFAWAVPGAVIALTWKWIFVGTSFGLVNMVLIDLGIVDSAVSFLSNKSIALPVVTIADAWIRMPFAMVVFLAGLQSIPNHMYDAAKVDGATTFQMFRNITVPYLRPYFAIVGLISWMFAFRSFAIIWPMTQGGPGTRTTTFAIQIYRVGMVRLDFGLGSAIAAFLVGVTVIVASFYVTVVLQRIEE